MSHFRFAMGLVVLMAVYAPSLDAVTLVRPRFQHHLPVFAATIVLHDSALAETPVPAETPVHLETPVPTAAPEIDAIAAPEIDATAVPEIDATAAPEIDARTPWHPSFESLTTIAGDTETGYFVDWHDEEMD